MSRIVILTLKAWPLRSEAPILSRLSHKRNFAIADADQLISVAVPLSVSNLATKIVYWLNRSNLHSSRNIAVPGLIVLLWYMYGVTQHKALEKVA